MKKVLFIMFALLQLSACVEIRDKKGDPATAGSAAPAPMVKEKKFEDLVIDEEMYVYDNRILNAADLDQAQKDNAYFHKRPAHDFEFHFDHLTISENGTLYTLGNNVRLHVQDLEVTSGLITTFPENQKADHDKIARPGGHILVDVQNPKGFLKIALRGEAGSNGLPGKNPDAALKGYKGKPGSDGDPDGKIACSKRATRGGPGGPGKKGYTGEDGQQGGDSGTLELRIQNDTLDFTYSIDVKPGKGGSGGVGGRGGEGGDFGNFGSASLLCVDMSGTNQKGSEGDPGDPGKSGRDGAKQTVCVQKNNQLSCN